MPISEDFTRFTYHQWVPFALGIGALLCLMPHVVWRMLSGLLWMDAHALLSTLAENQRQAADRRHVMLRDTAILLQAGFKRGNFFLTLGALFRKLLGCLTCLVQLVLVVTLFRPQLIVGPREEDEPSRDEDNEENDDGESARPINDSLPLPFGPFMCDFDVTRLQNVQKWRVQCTLPLNQVYSKAFTFLFYFFLLLAVLCVLDLLVWVGRVMIPGLRDAAVQRYLDAVSGGDGDGAVSQLYPRFSEYLGWDGRLLLALTADYCGPLAAADLTNHLWVIFKGAPRPSAAPAFPQTTGAASGVGDPAAIPLMPVNTRTETKPL
nr:hypothetical protein BaRGS_016305 [Batillaria attramentaria]